jgi:hypothetical protein
MNQRSRSASTPSFSTQSAQSRRPPSIKPNAIAACHATSVEAFLAISRATFMCLELLQTGRQERRISAHEFQIVSNIDQYAGNSMKHNPILLGVGGRPWDGSRRQYRTGCGDIRGRARFGSGQRRQGHCEQPVLLLAVGLMPEQVDRPELAKPPQGIHRSGFTRTEFTRRSGRQGIHHQLRAKHHPSIGRVSK